MRTALQIGLRGSSFTLLAVIAHVAVIVGAVYLLVAAGKLETAVAAALLPSWLDVAAASLVALIIGLVPSSRLRVLPVWLSCLTLGPLRVYAADVALGAFNFGPGALPLVHWRRTVEIWAAPPSLVIVAAVLLVGACAALPPPPVASCR